MIGPYAHRPRYKINKNDDLVPKVLWLDELYPARGVQTRKGCYSAVPYDVIRPNKFRLSEHARALQDARNEDGEALNWLTAQLSFLICSHALANSWRLNLGGVRGYRFASVALYPWVHSEKLSQQKSADLIGVDKKSFAKNWEPKLVEINRWIRRWIDEFKHI